MATTTMSWRQGRSFGVLAGRLTVVCHKSVNPQGSLELPFAYPAIERQHDLGRPRVTSS